LREEVERKTILGGGIFALIVLALVCIPRHVPSTASPVLLVPANFHAHLEQGMLTLRGSLPDTAARDRILQQAHSAYDHRHVRIVDQLAVDARIASATWLNQLPAVLPILGEMEGLGSVIIDGHFLVLSGRVPSEQTKGRILKTVAPLKSFGLELEDHMSIGAPAPAPPSLQSKLDEVLSQNRIEFDSNQSTLTARGRAVLDRLIPILQRYEPTSIEIGGHTDGFGAPDYNKELSRRRAEAVRQYLADHGVAHRMTAVGYGASMPRVPGISKAALQRNRRIELHVMDKRQL
jgi:OmpA-OmpF porin, OOP family